MNFSLMGLADAAAQGYWVGVAHTPFPGIGHVDANGQGKGYTWVPADYSAALPTPGKPIGQ